LAQVLFILSGLYVNFELSEENTSVCLILMANVVSRYSRNSFLGDSARADLAKVVLKLLDRIPSSLLETENGVTLMLDMSAVVGGVEVLVECSVLDRLSAVCATFRSQPEKRNVVDFADLLVLSGNMLRYLSDRSVSLSHPMFETLVDQVCRVLFQHAERFSYSLLLGDPLTSNKLLVSKATLSRASAAAYFLWQVEKCKVNIITDQSKTMRYYRELIRDSASLHMTLLANPHRLEEYARSTKSSEKKFQEGSDALIIRRDTFSLENWISSINSNAGFAETVIIDFFCPADGFKQGEARALKDMTFSLLFTLEHCALLLQHSCRTSMGQQTFSPGFGETSVMKIVEFLDFTMSTLADFYRIEISDSHPQYWELRRAMVSSFF
jgi:hypothetical protein